MLSCDQPTVAFHAGAGFFSAAAVEAAQLLVLEDSLVGHLLGVHQ